MKKLISTIIAFNLALLPVPVPAEETTEEKLTDKIYYYTDFSGEEAISGTSGITEGRYSLLEAESGESVFRFHSGNSSSNVNSALTLPEIKNPNKTETDEKADLPPVALEFKVRFPSYAATSSFDYQAQFGNEARGIGIGGMRLENKVRFDTSKLSAFCEIDDQKKWHTVTLLYSNEGYTRDLYIDGEYMGTSSDEDATNGRVNRWYHSGAFQYTFLLKNAKLNGGEDTYAELDYVKIYHPEYTAGMIIENDTAVPIGAITLNFSNPPVWDTVNSESFILSDGTEIAEILPDPSDSSKVILIPDEDLSEKSDYVITVTGIKDGLGKEYSGELSFTTAKRRQYARKLSLKTSDKLVHGSAVISSELVNELAGEITPVIYAVQTADGAVKKIDVFPHMLKGGETLPFEDDLEILNETDKLTLFAVRDEAAKGVISNALIYTNEGVEEIINPDEETGFKDKISEAKIDYIRFENILKVTSGAVDGIKAFFVYFDGELIYADATEKNEISFIPPGGRGTLSVEAFTSDGTKASEGAVEYISKTVTDEEFEKINSTDDFSVITTFALEYGRILGIDISAFESLNDAGRETASMIALSKRAELDDGVFKDFTAFEKVLKDSSAIASVVGGTATGETLLSNAELFGAENAVIIKSILTGEALDYLAVLLAEEECSDIEEATEFITNNIFIAGVYKAVNYSQIPALLRAAGASMSVYDSLKKPAVCEAKVYQKLYESTDALILAFEAAARSAKAAEGNQSGGGSGGGGGGGSLRQNVAFTPPVEKEEKEEEKVESVNSFTDLAGFEWAEDAILALYRKGVVSGRSGKEFAPAFSVTRAEFVKLVATALQLPEASESADYLDVSVEDWYYPYISSAAEKGIVSGVGEGRFAPSELVNREMAATILYRGFREGLKGEKSFADDKNISVWAKEAVSVLGGAGIIRGYSDGSFLPDRELSRAEAAQLIYNLLKNGGDI